MKKILITLIVLVTIANFSCSDFLEENPVTRITEMEAYSTPTLVYVNTVASLYNEVTRGGAFFSYSSYYRIMELSADLNYTPGRQGDWVDGGNHQNNFFHNWLA